AIQKGTPRGKNLRAHPQHSGDTAFLPAGRFHALGAGNLLIEIQQNSDTTYRVFDWNRVDDKGKPRQLHIEQALKCINFNDVKPKLIEVAKYISRLLMAIIRPAVNVRCSLIWSSFHPPNRDSARQTYDMCPLR